MLIREFFATAIYFYNEIQIRIDQEPPFELAGFFEYKSIERAETLITLSELQKLFEQSEQVVSIENLLPFKDFLETRWQRIFGDPVLGFTPLNYTVGYNHPLTHLCLSIADSISEYFQ